MYTPTLAAAILVSLALTVPVAAQTREKKAAEKDFPALVKAASSAFDSKQFSRSIESLRAAIKVAMLALENVVIDAMPQAPAGFEVRSRSRRSGPANPYAALMGTAATPIEQSYTGPKGASIKISCSIDSPVARMFSMALTLAAQDPDKEAIGYGDHKGLLEKRSGGERLNLQLLIAGKHVVTVTARGVSEDDLFGMIDQAFVDKFAKILGKYQYRSYRREAGCAHVGVGIRIRKLRAPEGYSGIRDRRPL